MTTKTVANYTEDQTVEMVDAYLNGVTVEVLATRMGRSVRSIVAKLAKEKVYKRSEPIKSTALTKADLISAIAVKFHLDPDALESLGKATKGTLEVLAGAAPLSE